MAIAVLWSVQATATSTSAGAAAEIREPRRRDTSRYAANTASAVASRAGDEELGVHRVQHHGQCTDAARAGDVGDEQQEGTGQDHPDDDDEGQGAGVDGEPGQRLDAGRGQREPGDGREVRSEGAGRERLSAQGDLANGEDARDVGVAHEEGRLPEHLRGLQKPGQGQGEHGRRCRSTSRQSQADRGRHDDEQDPDDVRRLPGGRGGRGGAGPAVMGGGYGQRYQEQPDGHDQERRPWPDRSTDRARGAQRSARGGVARSGSRLGRLGRPRFPGLSGSKVGRRRRGVEPGRRLVRG
ncbi:MAG: hypothetical protein M3171_04440 [Actinomycetota bacterium]|nr:hypothetical protein [Actinomycetota bacterium]